VSSTSHPSAAPEVMGDVLSLDDIHVYYGAIHALKGVTLRVGTGEIVTLIGANGAGKSTTLRAINGLNRPRQGSIRFQGADITTSAPHTIVKNGIAQSPEGRRLFGSLSVRENLELGSYRRAARAARAESMRRVCALFPVLGERLDAPAGTIVFLRDPTVRRHATAAEPGTTVLAVGGKPGEAYTPSAWEWYFEAERFRDPLDPEAALRLMDEANERFPDHVGVVYSTACWEALAGRPDDAWETLQQAIALDPKAREWALGDEDLAAIRDRLRADG